MALDFANYYEVFESDTRSADVTSGNILMPPDATGFLLYLNVTAITTTPTVQPMVFPVLGSDWSATVPYVTMASLALSVGYKRWYIGSSEYEASGNFVDQTRQILPRTFTLELAFTGAGDYTAGARMMWVK